MNPMQFDYIIIGAGSSGCVLAARLSEHPENRVLVLEAGGDDAHLFLKMPLAFLMAMTHPRFNWNYMTEPEPALGGRPLPLPRGRVLGGTSSINGMFYMRGHPADYNEWAQMGARGWSYAEVLPYFRRAETSWRGEGKYHGATGPLQVAPIDSKHIYHQELMDAGRAAGYPISEDLSAEMAEGFALGEATIDRRGRRSSTASAYLHPAMSRPNLTVITGALVEKILLENRRAVGVAFRLRGERQIARSRREVIVSGGTFNSPHLLMLSGIGPASTLQQHGIEVVHDNPAVGQNLSEHVTVPLEWDANGPISFLKYLRMDRLACSAMRWALTGGGPMASQIASANIVIRTTSELDRPDIQLMAAPVKLDAKPWLPGISPKQAHVFWGGVVLLHPHSRGQVTLKSADPAELPAIQLNLLTDSRDFAPLRRGIHAARRIYRSGKQAALTGAERIPGNACQSDAQLDAYIRQSAYIAQHPVGTCAMGTGPDAVTDPELRVIGISGLRVVDASIMPTVPGANTNASAIMIGEKATDMILGRPPLPRADI